VTLLALAVAGRGLVAPDEPVFFADDEAVVRGTAAFDTVRIRRGRAVMLDRHIERLGRSSQALRLPPPDGVHDLALQAIDAAGVDEGGLRLYRTTRSLVAAVAALAPDLDETRERGLALVTMQITAHTPLTGIKSTSYGVNMAAVAEAESRGAADALFIAEDGTVLEATTANVWWRVGDELTTPALSTGVLPGVTRAAVAELARTEGFRVSEGSSALSELFDAEEVFTSSAIREIMPVVSIDGREVPRGDAAPRLQLLLEALTL
jgi:4-amino-4-deoxychorismate lyase